MKFFSGFNAGQYGDLVTNTVAAKRLKELHPDCLLSLGISLKYAGAELLFRRHPFIDETHIWEGYDDFPTEYDKKLIKAKGFSDVFSPMPKHDYSNGPWFSKRHQTSEVCFMHGLGDVPAEQCYLTRWFPKISGYEDYITLAPFAGWYNQSNQKKLTVEKADEVCLCIRKLGYKVFQTGGPDEPRLRYAEKPNLSIFESVQMMLSTKALVHTDTFMGWAASAYEHKQIGLYSDAEYQIGDRNFVHNIQPINPNFIPINAPNVNEILCEQIESALKYIP